MGTANTTADVRPSNTIATAICLYFPFLVVGLLLFEIIQSWVVNRHGTENLATFVYAARRRDQSTTCPPVQRGYKPFGWIWPVLCTSDDQVFEYCGLDTLCFLRVLRLGEKFAATGVALSVVLFPLYATATHPLEDDRKNIDPLERITMSNLDRGEPRIWASVFAMYVMTFLAFYLFAEEYKVYIRRRHEFLGQLGPQQYSVLVKDLPRALRGPQPLFEYMQRLFPNGVHSVHVAMECARLEEQVARRVEVRDALEEALAVYAKTHVRPEHRPGPKWKICTSTPVDSIHVYQSKLDILNSKIAEEVRALLQAYGRENPGAGPPAGAGTENRDSDNIQLNLGAGEPNMLARALGTESGASRVTARARSSAFVSFRTLQAAQSAQQLLYSEESTDMEVCPAPYPQDIVWENYGQPHRVRESWQLISWLVTILIILFWTIPTSFVATLASVDRLKELIPDLERTLEAAPWLTEVLKQLSPLGLILMSVLAYYIFGFLARREGYVSGCEVAASHFGKLVYFQTFQIFFVSVIAGTVFDSLNEIINEPKRIINLLGTTMPGKAITFMAYLILQAGLKLALEILLLVPMALSLLYEVCAPKRTAAQRQRGAPWLGFIRPPATGQGEFELIQRLPHYFLAMLLVFAFCAIAPLLSYFAGFFFFASDIVYRRQVFFVYDPSRGSTGVFWPQLHDFLVGGLLLAQITFLGLTSLKVAPGPITMATILPFFTVAYYLYSKSRWPRVAKNLPLNKCWELDEERTRVLGKEGFKFLDGVYIQPALGEGESLIPEGPMEGGGNSCGVEDSAGEESADRPSTDTTTATTKN